MDVGSDVADTSDMRLVERAPVQRTATAPQRRPELGLLVDLARSGRMSHAAPSAALALQRMLGNARTTGVLAVQRDAKPGSTFEMPGPAKTIKGHPDFHREGSKTLTAGTMRWSLVITIDGMHPGKYTGAPSAIMQIVFTPKASGQTITFLQTVALSRLGADATPGKPSVDVLPDDFDPFYGAQWDPKALSWVPEGAPERYRNAPSDASDPSGYLYDAPSAPPSTAKMFESVAVDTRTGLLLGAVRWGVGGGRLLAGQDPDCTDKPTGEFGAAVESFYATPVSGTPAAPRFEAILDEFGYGDTTLSAEHRTHLDRVAQKYTKTIKERKVRVLVAGFGDKLDKDPIDASKRRAAAVLDYLTQHGVPASDINPTAFGATWPRAPVSMKEGRNRRVQIRLRYPDK